MARDQPKLDGMTTVFKDYAFKVLLSTTSSISTTMNIVLSVVVVFVVVVVVVVIVVVVVVGSVKRTKNKLVWNVRQNNLMTILHFFTWY